MKTPQQIGLFLFFLITLSLTAQNKAFEVSIEGKGQPILLFPGFSCTGAVWESTVAELSKNYECHIFTFAGFGGVTPIEKPWLPKIKEGINAYVKEQQLKDPIIIGHSLGCALGLWLTSEKNNPYSKLIVVDALPSTGALMIPNFKSENMVYESPWNKQMLEMDTQEFEGMASQMVIGMTLNTEKQAQIKNWMIQADRETYVYGYTDLLKLDLREDLAQISIPVVILAATHPYGLEITKGTYESQYKNLESYAIEFAEGAAHFIMYDKLAWFISKISKYIK